jgi:YfiH family protein
MQALSATSERQPFEFAHLRGVPGLRHGITRREGPGLAGNVAFTRGPDVASVVAARQRWCQRIGVDPAGLVVARQIHGVAVERVTRRERGRGALTPIVLPEADALATDEPDVPLLAIFADCVPVVLVDPVRRAVAVVHAGWRGTVAGVVEAAVAALTAWYGSRPADLLAGIGPSIGPCCYEVGPEVAAAALAHHGPAVLRPGPTGDRPAFDLWAANQQALQRAGLTAERVATAGVCTRCHNHLYFSHRAEGPQRGLFGAIVALT